MISKPLDDIPNLIQESVIYIRQLVHQGGPRERDYPALDYWLVDIHNHLLAGQLSRDNLAEIRAAFGDALSPATMQGFAFAKPHGYAGDFEMIDRIYQSYRCPQPHLAHWDAFFHQHAASKAVRNRKTYFHRLLDRQSACKQPLRVLQIASGPGRDMVEWLTMNPKAAISFDCIEVDPQAIAYASRLNHQFLDRIRFTQKNVLRFQPSETYDLIWAAGIFDYFEDKIFVKLLQRLLPALADDGEMVIGNYSNRNPSQAYMEVVGDWKLYHRSKQRLRSLVQQCGVLSHQMTLHAEPEQVNAFVHVTRPMLPS